MKLENEELVKQYWEKMKDTYPQYTYEEFREACRSPMMYARHRLKDKSLPFIFIQHLGTFRVFENHIKSANVTNEKYKMLGYITEEVYQQKKAFYEGYLKELEREDNDEEIEIIDDINTNNDQTNSTESNSDTDREKTSD